MKNTNWYRIQSGQIVRFRYKNMKGESSNRTAYVLAPRYKYRKQSTGRVVEFFIGLEIENTAKQSINPLVLKEMFEEINDIFEDSEKSADYTDERVITRIYENLKRFLNGTPIFRTYFLRECRKRRVFLEDKYANLNSMQVKQVTEQLLQEGQDTLIIGDDIGL